MKAKNILPYIVGGLILYFISTGVSYGAFTLLRGGEKAVAPIPSNGTGFVIDPSLPKTEACPLTGEMFTKQERDIWEKRRPLAVMIENHEEARPQSGLSYADIVYEAVAEGGITRFMGIYYCGIAAYNIGLAPVRSARTYFVDWVSEYDALYNHVGGAGQCNDDTVDERAKALCQIERYGIKDMDQFGISFPICYRNYDRLDHTVATEHTMVCFSTKLYELAAKRNWTNVDEENIPWDKNYEPWKFKDEAKTADRGPGGTVSFVHWPDYEAEYGVAWTYDTATNAYKRANGGQPHLDLETKQQLTAKNVVIQFAKETDGVDDHAHIIYGTIGGGKALIFQDGKTIVGIWKKASRVARTKFYDEKGSEVEFSRGKIWIEVVATDTKVTY